MPPESNSSIEDAARYIQNAMCREDLQLFLADRHAWKNFVTEAKLSRDEAGALYGYLKDPETEKEGMEDRNMLWLWLRLSFVFGLGLFLVLWLDLGLGLKLFLVLGLGLGLGLVLGFGLPSGLKLLSAKGNKREEEEMIQKEKAYRLMFLEEYPFVKQKLKKRIAELRALADRVDKVHRNCVISSVVTNATGILSGILTSSSLTLAPRNAEVSLKLSATGMVLETAAAIGSLTTNMLKHSSMSSTEAEFRRLTSTNISQEMVNMETGHDNVPNMIHLRNTFMRGMKGIEKNIHAIKLAKESSRLVPRAKRVMTSGVISAPKRRQVEKAFGGTVLAMSKETRMLGIANAANLVLFDAYNFVQESKHLYEGAKTESAEQLRQWAHELELKLEQLEQIHARLQ
ncbi:apolipoprotein L3-like isoform X1 [Erinaceus europaeus]|uniref:Apolipoprotein L3-like isoform X1 n=2 Tax=Erinaceus europaeus TaxID=9365 RepID=A0A1S3WA84_ERIEU|nr:apolipoprotein L3-like isoform X1 [Erinaceus europaeus]XP_060045116.1 apolipoprotein L3-like isoform X1 [Erinaceus europaeus]XP_060045117.1 apolipoprotein L3-like isoform X1 [Erinaceus europaeus]XP_060045118.1 apolipoprotein L3-like isoform X1 [Erinaceus europaeus]